MAEIKRIEKYSFSVANKIGTGAFSKVYKGLDEKTQKIVAIKVIEMATIKNQTFVNLLQNEVTVMKGLNHENIVKLEDVYNTANNIYLVTEFCNGGDVGDILTSKKRLQESQVKTILKDIMKGLQELISKKIIHRDLKPQNFFIHNGVHKIGDFGFAKFLNSEDEVIVTTMLGTPLYMSPQCLGKKGYSSKCDIWSLGICMYEMLTGNTPWPSNNHLELLNNMQNVSIKFPKDIVISQMMKNIILRCLSVNEEFRITWKELFEHPILFEALAFQTGFGNEKSSTFLAEKKNLAFSCTTGKTENKSTSHIFIDRSNATTRISKNENIDTILKNASTKIQKTVRPTVYQPPTSGISEAKLSEISNENENTFKILSFMKVICQNIEELKDKLALSPLVLDKLLFTISKQLAILCKNIIQNAINLKGDTIHFIHEGKKYFFRIYSTMKESNGNGIIKGEDPEFFQIFNNEINEDITIVKTMKKYLIRCIREINHICLLKFLKENEDKGNLPHTLIFLSALVDFFDIINQIEGMTKLTQLGGVEISKVLTKKENTDVDYYKKIRRKIFELEI